MNVYRRPFSPDRPESPAQGKRGRWASVLAVGCFVVLIVLFVGPCLSAFRLQRLPDAGLADVSRSTGLEFPDSAVLVDAWIDPAGMDATLYYRVKIRDSEVEEFTHQELTKDKWKKGNLVAQHVRHPKIRRSWREVSRTTDCRSCRIDIPPDEWLWTSVCPNDADAPGVSTVYIVLELL